MSSDPSSVTILFNVNLRGKVANITIKHYRFIILRKFDISLYASVF